MSRFFCLATEHLYGNFRAHNGTEGTACAFTVLTLFTLSVFSRMIALDIQRTAYLDRALGTGSYAKTASFAQIFVDPDKALLQLSIPSERITRNASSKRCNIRPSSPMCQGKFRGERNIGSMLDTKQPPVPPPTLEAIPEPLLGSGEEV